MDKLPGFTMNSDKYYNFRQGPGGRTDVASFTEVVEEKAFLTWEIEGISDDTKWEAIKAQAKCFLELGKNTTQPHKLCFYVSVDGSGLPGLFCKTLNEYQHDVVLQVKIEKFNVDGSSALILDTAMRTLKKDTGGTGKASCCILDGNAGQSTGLFPVRTPTNPIFRNPSSSQPPAKVLGEQDFIRIGISVSMFSCKDSQKTQPAALKVAEESLTKDLGTLYNDGNGKVFFPDLEPESKDGIRLKLTSSF